jgi:hypothetical protein
MDNPPAPIEPETGSSHRSLSRSGNVRFALLSALLAVLLAAPLQAQSPSADWMTITTPHFRVHYPRDYEEWATRAARRLESVRTIVSEEIGFVPSQTIDVLIVNPVAQPNGVAWPLLDTPRMIFFAEPPGPEEQIGAYGHWIDLLAIHETAHLVHMLRPSRNPLQRMLERSVFPLNPITLRAPRWVLEGYATVIEGRLTGSGRPHSTVRALILRRWAESGRLPSYRQLNSDQRFLGMSMAYLMGSAYLEWLEERSGPDSLRNLWARMTARHRRSFDEAFIGVFGDRPDRLYGRFVAELTASAMAIDRASEYVEGELFQETPRASGDPAVSPDGTRIAFVVRDREKPQRLVIWSTAAPDDEEKKYQERLAKILERDPEDVAPVRTRPLPRKAIHSLVMPDGGDIDEPSWMPDGESILFAHRMPDTEGFLHFDLFQWTPGTGNLRRITRLADVKSPDPLPGGRTAIAVRSRYGASQLVSVDLATGAVTPESEASIDIVYTQPRVSPDGSRQAWVAHREGGWKLFVDGEHLVLPGDPAAPAWLSNDELIVTLYSGGFAELHRVSLNGDSTVVTRSRGGAFQPTPTTGGRVFFMSLNPDGYVLRLLPSLESAPRPPALAGDLSLVPAVPRPQPAPVPPLPETDVTARRYGIGRQEPAWLMSQSLTPGYRSTELGLRLGDVAGRLNTLLVGALGSGDAPEGGALMTAWRGWPVTLQAHLYSAGDDGDGIEARGSWTRRFPLARLSVEGGALSDDLLFGAVTLSTWQVAGTSRFEQTIAGEVDGAHRRARAALGYRQGAFRVGASYQLDRGEIVSLGGPGSSILPRSAYARRVLDPALPVALLQGDDYDGWRIETRVPQLPFTFFYQRHELAASRVSLVGGEIAWNAPPNPILKTPGLELTLGAARILDGLPEEETNVWIAMRWRP